MRGRWVDAVQPGRVCVPSVGRRRPAWCFDAMTPSHQNGLLPSVFSALLRPTRLRSAEPSSEDRHATWFELFFDLVFVLAVAELAKMLQRDLSAVGFLRFAALFVPVWWAWVIYTTYADRFETDDIIYRVMMMAGMLAIVTMAASLHSALDESGS